MDLDIPFQTHLQFRSDLSHPVTAIQDHTLQVLTLTIQSTSIHARFSQSNTAVTTTLHRSGHFGISVNSTARMFVQPTPMCSSPTEQLQDSDVTAVTSYALRHEV